MLVIEPNDIVLYIYIQYCAHDDSLITFDLSVLTLMK